MKKFQKALGDSPNVLVPQREHAKAGKSDGYPLR
jgi:hypothetical protein